MRTMIVTGLAVVATAVVLWSQPGVRNRAEGILLAGAHRRVAAQASTPKQNSPPAQNEPEPPSNDQTPSAAAETRSESGGPAESEPPPAAAQTRPIRLPPPLDRAAFGMTREQLERAFDISWRGEDYSGSQPVSVLAHYMTEDRRQLAKFRLLDGELKTIEVNVKPATDQPLDQLYQRWRSWLTERHGDAAGSEPARWSDRRVSVRVGRDADRRVVWIRYSRTSDG